MTFRPIRTLEARERFVNALASRVRGDRAAAVAAAVECGDLPRALALVASLDRVAAAVEAHSECHAGELLYAIAHELTARRADARQLRRALARHARHGRCDSLPSPSVQPRALAARVSRSQLGLALGAPTAGAQSAVESQGLAPRVAPWERSK